MATHGAITVGQASKTLPMTFQDLVPVRLAKMQTTR